MRVEKYAWSLSSILVVIWPRRKQSFEVSSRPVCILPAALGQAKSLSPGYLSMFGFHPSTGDTPPHIFGFPRQAAGLARKIGFFLRQVADMYCSFSLAVRS